jgi:purine-cytosine permease-like protein
VTLVLVYLGAFVWTAFDTVSAFILILIVVCTPWMIISLMGMLVARGRYWPYDLQLFNIGKRGGAYWYTAGWNLRALIAFVPAVVIGMMFVNTTLYIGPWANAVNGVDMSFISSAVISAVIYGVAVLLSKERNHPKADETAFQSPFPVGDLIRHRRESADTSKAAT